MKIRYNSLPQIIFVLKYGTKICCLLSRVKYINGLFSELPVSPEFF